MMQSERIRIYPASREQMEQVLHAEEDEDLRKAYREMLEGCLSHPEQREWYAMWMIEKTDGTLLGDLCFKGVQDDRSPEIGYGIREAFQGQGYATEAVRLAPAGITGDEGPRFIVFREENMNAKDYTIRLEKKEDAREVENLVRESFWNVYRPGCSEHYVIHVLREDPAFVKELDFVMEKDGKLIGQNMFMKTVIEADDGRVIPVLTMGPIGITPELKRKGYGKALLDYSLEKAAEMGFGAVLFEGNIDFYGKSGFDYASRFGIRYHDLPEDADSSFFLCKELIPGYLDDVTGVYQTPQGYYVDDADVEEFDKGFPAKEKLKLPGQIFG